ncbi:MULTISPECIES: ImmA/IrrE family metallo-endopeptidase [unclassified Cytobacillus]|uniref:ImmA/IrrE family metallo-endopeptidase n=1 Tax=unclassified Cytobacillus TaxID=2675268 RepID=UPI00203D26FF|nr:ImmA/IrrE family metallo-endopeptidase [Cytobacillus sp. AMY 15.2]MCM3090171.1 ImmA/IrrE family metallo-endopeptidase [Cytobacillus sp. AMY 15.2]
MKDFIVDEVQKLIKKFKTRDPFLIAESLGVHVVPWDFTDEVQGMYKYERRNKFIFINNNLGKVRNFVMGHELGHAILHPKHNTSFLKKNTFFPESKYERQASQFAVELLLPDESLRDYENSDLSIYEIAEIHGVPRELAHLKKF